MGGPQRPRWRGVPEPPRHLGRCGLRATRSPRPRQGVPVTTVVIAPGVTWTLTVTGGIGPRVVAPVIVKAYRAGARSGAAVIVIVTASPVDRSRSSVTVSPLGTFCVKITAYAARLAMRCTFTVAVVVAPAATVTVDCGSWNWKPNDALLA